MSSASHLPKGDMETIAVQKRSFLAWGVLIVGLGLWLSSLQQSSPLKTFTVPEISIGDAVMAIARGAIVIDVRQRDAFEKGHIAGALSVPLEELKRRAHEHAAMTDKEFVIYCGDGSTLGPEGTKALQDAGHQGTKNLAAGFSGWKEAGHAVASGAK
jgi:rhodanese-related sulfurtransferase